MDAFFDDLARPNIRSLTPYQPGKPVEELERELGISGAVKVASNENPLGPSPLALEAARAALAQVHRYPDGACFKLRRALAERLPCDPDELIFGGGSNELIYLIVHAFCRPGGADEVLTHAHAFVSYRIAAHACDVPFVEAPDTADLACDMDALIAAITPRTKIVFLANPNNPTGSHVRRPEFERLLEALPLRALLVVDEAYYEHAIQAPGADYPDALAYRTQARPQIVALRTFSKIHGLAGLRLGYGVADRRVAEYLQRLRRPFNASSVAQAAALAALDDAAHIQRSIDAARDGVARISADARRLGLRPYPSLCNFVLVGVGRDALPVYDALLHRGVIVRPMAAWGLPRHIRVSIGTPEQLDRVAAALADVIG
jgi:histidinol-phosphate aminotransferase